MIHRPIESTARRAPLLVESDAIALASSETNEILVLSAVGPLPGASVWFQGPAAWSGSSEKVTVRLYARVASIRVKLAEASLDRVPATLEAGHAHALVLSCQGIDAAAYEVTVQRASAGAPTLSDGVFVLFAAGEPAPLALVGEGGVAAGQNVRLTAPAAVIQPSPALLQATAAQGAAAAQSSRWPVFLSDGAAERGTPSSPLVVRASDERAAYAAGVEVSTGTSTATRLLLHLWNAASTNRRVEVRRILISYHGNGTQSVRLTLRGTRITSSTGSSVVKPESFDPGDPDASAVVRKEPTASSSSPSSADIFFFSASTTQDRVFVWEAADRGKPFVLPAGKDGGLEIRSTLSTNINTAAPLAISLEWIEI